MTVTVAETQTLDVLLEQAGALIAAIRQAQSGDGELPERGTVKRSLTELGKEFEARLTLERGRSSASGRRQQAQRLAGLLSIRTDVEVVLPYDKHIRTHTITWTDGPDDVHMRELVAELADQAPALDVEMLSYDRSVTPPAETPAPDVAVAKPAELVEAKPPVGPEAPKVTAVPARRTASPPVPLPVPVDTAKTEPTAVDACPAPPAPPPELTRAQRTQVVERKRLARGRHARRSALQRLNLAPILLGFVLMVAGFGVLLGSTSAGIVSIAEQAIYQTADQVRQDYLNGRVPQTPAPGPVQASSVGSW